MIVVAGTIEIKPDKREEAVQVALRMSQATQAEEGCIHYQFYGDLSDPNTFLVFEEWETAEALEAHFETEHMKEFRQQLPGLVAGGRNIKRYEIKSVASL